MIRIAALFILSFISFLINAQPSNYTTTKTVSGKAKDKYEKAKEYWRIGNAAEAIKYADAAYKADPLFLDAILYKAAIYNATKNYKLAETSFEEVIAIAPNYDNDVYFSLAEIEKQQNKFEEAISHYQTFIANGPTNKKSLKAAQAGLEQCLFIVQALKNPVPFDPKPLSNSINTSIHNEYLPCLSADGETFIFTRRVHNDEDFYLSKKENGVWAVAKPIDKVNTELNEGAETISADGKIMVFTACNRLKGFGSCDLYFAELSENGWTTPQNMGAPINSRAWESQPCLSADGQTIYFASSREGGFGGQDIWYSKKENGKWIEPINAGANINTESDDAGPFLHQDGQTLYFMSNGRGGMGGFDLFLSRKNANGVWEKPQNLGYPINSQRDEGSLFVSLDGSKGYFASDRKYQNNAKHSVFDKETKGLDYSQITETDIYEFDLYESARPKPTTYVKGKIYDANTLKNLRAKVEIIDVETNQSVATAISDWKGEFLLCLPYGKNYAFTVSRAKYALYSNNFNLKDTTLSRKKPYSLDIPLILLENIPTVGNTNPTIDKTKRVVILKNIFFESASAKLLPSSLSELNRLKAMLDDSSSLVIQINGHTDNEGADSYNLALSNNRAQAVYDYLIQQGIAATRLKYKGFGESQPITTNDTPEGRQENRRTEFEIISF
jgi:outer membrane protein OmpA-like peptidoglycan-associated protein